MNGCGLGDYVSFDLCPYPEAVAQFATVEVPAGLLEEPCPCMRGLGVFESGLNFDQWGFAEWAAVAAGTYLVVSLFQDTSRAATRVKRYSRRRRVTASADDYETTRRRNPGGRR